MKNLLSILLLLAISLTLAGCLKDKRAASTNNNGNTIKIGIYGDLTGQTSSFGQSTKNGVDLAVNEINSAGGINGKNLEIIFEDDQGRPEQAKTVVSKLINQDKVQAVIGEAASTNTLAAAPVAQEARVPMISHASTNEQITRVGDYIFRVCFIDAFQGAVDRKSVV